MIVAAIDIRKTRSLAVMIFHLAITLCSFFCCCLANNADPPISLTVVGDPEINITEPDTGETALISTCFEAEVIGPRMNAAVFEIEVANSSTATEGVDYYFRNMSNRNITIPVSFNGTFTYCIEAEVVGDEDIEPNEFVNVTLRPVSPFDMADFNVVWSILDNDGKR